MDELFHLIEEYDVYIDDVGVFSDNFDEHLKSLDKILMILQEHGFTINPDTDPSSADTNPIVCRKCQFLSTHVAETRSYPRAINSIARKERCSMDRDPYRGI
eukprot:scaffold133401_cov46-Attheya_sp.AAC.1